MKCVNCDLEIFENEQTSISGKYHFFCSDCRARLKSALAERDAQLAVVTTDRDCWIDLKEDADKRIAELLQLLNRIKGRVYHAPDCAFDCDCDMNEIETEIKAVVEQSFNPLGEP